jgi:putative MATE family efflux protein
VQDPGVQTAGTAYLDIRLLTLPIIGLNFAFRGYFNGVQRPKVYMSTLLLMHPLNILLNYLLIFGNFGFPALGVRGAAIGTVIATTLGCSIFALLMFAGERARMRSLFGLVSKKAMGTLLKLAIPSGLQSLSLAGGYLVFFRIAGMVSTEALAGVNILVNLGLIGILISMGIGLGTLTLVGNALGERDTAQARGWVRSALLLVTLLVGSLGLILAGFPEFWLGIFIQDPKVIQVAVIPIILLGLSQSYDGAAMVLMHAHLGGGAVKTVMVVSFVTQWLVFLPACYIWVSFFNGQLVHLYICMITYRFLLFLAFYLSIRKERWLSIAI